MSECICGYNGWFSPTEPDCPKHGLRGSENTDYQRGLQQRVAQSTPTATVELPRSNMTDEQRIAVWLHKSGAPGLAARLLAGEWKKIV